MVSLERQPEPTSCDPLDVYEGFERVPAHRQNVTTPLVAMLTGFLQPCAAGEILEIGPGSGAITIELARNLPAARFHGVDLSAEMVEFANRRAEEAGLADRVSFARGDARELRLETGRFDAVYSNHLVPHQLPTRDDALAALREMGRVVKSTGRIAIRDVIRPATEDELGLFLERIGCIYPEALRAIYEHSIRAGYRPAEFQELVRESGLFSPVHAGHFATSFAFGLFTHNEFLRVPLSI